MTSLISVPSILTILWPEGSTQSSPAMPSRTRLAGNWAGIWVGPEFEMNYPALGLSKECISERLGQIFDDPVAA